MSNEAQVAVAESEDENADDGPAVSEAVCTAAHDRRTLPHGEDAAEEGDDEDVDTESKDCTHPSNVESDSESDEEILDEEVAEADQQLEEDEALNHGQSVSQAIHEAKASLEDGEKVGPAVSEAACMAAQDRETLPQTAQQAPGQIKKMTKDCTHPSNAGADEEDSSSLPVGSNGNGTSGGHGKQSAPGQLKKQPD